MYVLITSAHFLKGANNSEVDGNAIFTNRKLYSVLLPVTKNVQKDIKKRPV